MNLECHYRWFRLVRNAITVLIFIAISLPSNTSAGATAPHQMDFYTVQAEDTWASISARYSIALISLWNTNGVTNPDLLVPGHRLFIPNGSSQKAVLAFTPSATTPWQAAIQSGNTIHAILLINGLYSPAADAITDLYAPNRRDSTQTASVQPTPTLLASPTPELPAQTPVPGPPLDRSRLGIQGYFGIPELMDFWLSRITNAEFTWVKYQVDWRLLENPPDVYPMLAFLDGFMDNAQGRDLNVLLSVVKAPDWARSTTEGYGPPTDYREYTNFVAWLADRYKNRLDTMEIAFEIWNEPNTQREWTGSPISAQDYVRLLAGAYVAIKEVDTRYTVISAGLAPTGINDGVTAIDDRVYLRQMYDAELARVSDAVGIHPYGWSNPPSARCCGDLNTAPGYDEHPSFFFLNTVEDYRAIQTEYGDTHKLWATEFGWGSMEGTGLPTPDNSPFFADITQELQAEYIWQAYVMAQQWDYMGPMFLWNINMLTIPGAEPDTAGYSIFLSPDNPRPAYILLKDAPKTGEPEP